MTSILRLVCILLILGNLSPAFAKDWSRNGSFTYFNDFSESIYFDGARFNSTGPYPRAAKIKDNTLLVTITPNMLDRNKKTTGRFELEKANIASGLAVYQKFKIRSKGNKVTDRVLIGQIKYTHKDSDGTSPIAAVYLDRYPGCVTFTKSSKYKTGEHLVVEDNEHGVTSPSYLWVEDVKSERQHSWYLSYHFNRPWRHLNDGEWHVVEMDVFPHQSKGYCIIKIDGKFWHAIINAPTKTTRNTGYSIYAARIGVYRDAVEYDHTVQFDDWFVEAYEPDTGPRISLQDAKTWTSNRIPNNQKNHDWECTACNTWKSLLESPKE